MDYEKKYKEAIKRAKHYKEGITDRKLEKDENIMDYIFPELKESEDERIRKVLIKGFQHYDKECKWGEFTTTEILSWLEKQVEPTDKGEISDGYHTFNELYYYRMLYNAAFFNMLPKEWVHKSKKHHDGEECFGGGWFIVIANLPTGQISNHYELKDWDLFQIPEKEVADEWDGHTPKEAAERLHKYLLEKQGKQEYALKSSKDEDVRNFMQQIKKEAKAYEFNLPNRDYDIYAFAKDILAWLEKQGEKKPWSEDDEKMIRSICCYLNEFGNWLSDKNDEKSQSIYKACDWLKSLKPQNIKRRNV